MGTYINPGNSGFQRILNARYVDKTGMIDLMNERLDSPQGLVCISRPRRFGKSFAAQMLCAYYDMSCDSHALFDDKEIAKTAGYERHINRYHMVSLDIAAFISEAGRLGRKLIEVPGMISDVLRQEIVQLYPYLSDEKCLTDCLLRCAEREKRKFVFVIDEWDALIREAKDDSQAQSAYLHLLREWFKNNNFTPKVVTGAYMTGILPIKKDGSESAVSDFREYSVLDPGRFAAYTGFLEQDVRMLCAQYAISFDEAKAWYDGYTLGDIREVYNPYSVMCAAENGKCRSFWRKTSAAESLMTYVNMDFDGLQETISRLIAGEEVEVDTSGFENDVETFRNRDDVLTLLIHLGYLTFDEEESLARIPNEEVRIEFGNILKNTGLNNGWVKLIRRSRQLLQDTINGRADAVTRGIEEIRDIQYAPTFYNNEQALRSVIKYAYIAGIDQYIKVEELLSGHGIADVVYIPGKRSMLPALVIELKWNKTAEGAISQIKDKRYPAILQGFGGEIILVGINYDEKTKKHSCAIERISEMA